MGKHCLARDRVPGVAAHQLVAHRNADHHRRAEPPVRAPAQAAQVGDLLVRRVGILAELDLRHRAQAAGRHADRPPDNALLVETSVKHARLAEAGLQPFADAMHPGKRAHIFTEHQHRRVMGQLVFQRLADGLLHRQPLAHGVRLGGRDGLRGGKEVRGCIVGRRVVAFVPSGFRLRANKGRRRLL